MGEAFAIPPASLTAIDAADRIETNTTQATIATEDTKQMAIVVEDRPSTERISEAVSIEPEAASLTMQPRVPTPPKEEEWAIPGLNFL